MCLLHIKEIINMSMIAIKLMRSLITQPSTILKDALSRLKQKSGMDVHTSTQLIWATMIPHIRKFQ